MIDALSTILDAAVEAGEVPGAQACVIHHGRRVHASAHGRCGIVGPPVDLATRFDVASLTKAIVTTTGAYVLLSRGLLRLDDPVGRWFAPFGRGEKAKVTVRHLLAHTSGLPAWRPLFAQILADPELRRLYPGLQGPEPAVRPSDGDPLAPLRRRAREIVIAQAAEAPLEFAPGSTCVYSDLGFILLGEILAACAGMPLDRFAREAILDPLGLRATGYRPVPAPPEPNLAATGRTRPRPPARGQEGLYEIPPQRERDDFEVDDDNAWAMGGVSGHAGLFSTAADVAAWGEAIRAERQGARRLGDPEVLETMLAPDPHPYGPPRALGFDLPSGPASSAGRRLGRRGPRGARGHLAFTGCSVWIDFDRALTVALLTNRVHPDRSNEAGIRRLRPLFHDAVVDSLEPEPPEETP